MVFHSVMRFARHLTLLLVMTHAVSAMAQESPADRGDITLDLGFYTAFPVALGTGQTLGGSVGFAWRVPEHGWFFGARTRLGRATEYDLSWEVEHDELLVVGVAGWRAALGQSGEVEVGLGVGVDVIFEERFRHQGERLGTSVDAPTTESGVTAAFYTEFTVSVRLFLLDDFGLAVSGGPALAVLSLAGQTEARLGGSALLSIVWRYPEREED